MGKSEILMLLAGVALSIMLAMIAVPMFSSGNEMADRQQVQQELMAINSAIPLIKSLEGNEYIGVSPDGVGKITAENIARHMEGFEKGTAADTLKGSKGGLAIFTIDDKEKSNPNNTITVDISTTDSNVNLNKLSRLGSICLKATKDTNGVVTYEAGTKGDKGDYNISEEGKKLTGCKMKR